MSNTETRECSHEFQRQTCSECLQETKKLECTKCGMIGTVFTKGIDLRKAQTDPPQKFEKLFQKEFWNILSEDDE